MLHSKIAMTLVLFAINPDLALGAAQVSVGGFAQTNHRRLETEEKTSLSASVAFDIFSMMQLGYTLRTSKEMTYGNNYSPARAEGLQYIPFDLSQEAVKQSVDLTIVPFMTRTLVPFVFGGVARTTYVTRRYYDFPPEYEDIDERETLKPGKGTNPLFAPNYGIGVRIPLNNDFSIKVTQTWTEGITQEPDEEARKATDTSTEFAISYNL